jgi:L-ascorbate metabolism protein UlaG (beta-lactamase superfamily)
VPGSRAFAAARHPAGWVVIAAVAGASCYAPVVARERSYHPSDADLTVTRLVHGSAILDFAGNRVLLDPWYSPSPPFGQGETIGLALDKLPPFRGILITHRHDDHFDSETLENFVDKTVRVVVPRGLGAEVGRMGYQDVVEVEPWEETQIGSIIVVPVPAKHSVREVGYVLRKDDVVVYAAGDTLFEEDEMHEIAVAFPKIDVALLPVGGIRVLGRRLDMDAEEAARAFGILQPKHAIPVHYALTGPFPFVLSHAGAAEEFAADVQAAGGAPGSVVVLQAGDSWHHYQ